VSIEQPAATAAAGTLAVLYRLLSLGFTPPDEETLEQVRRLCVLGARHAEEEGLAELLGELGHSLDDDELLPKLQAEHDALFGGAVRCSPYEASYEADPFRQTRQMADLAGFYRAFGADTSGPAAERPDHAGCELEFLSFLTAKRASALEARDGEHAAVCLEAEEAFLRDHLGRWFPAFCREVAASTSSAAYRLLALAGERLVVAELARRGIEPVPLSARRRLSAVEGDEIVCGGGAEAALSVPPAPLA
jgi:TorA maturation chaperone TorD